MKQQVSNHRIGAGIARATITAATRAALSLTPVLVPLMLSACAGSTHSTAATTPAQPDALTVLRSLAQREQTDPNRSAQSLSTAPGMDAGAIQPRPESELRPGAKSIMPLEEAIASATVNFTIDRAPAPSADERPDPETKASALKSYASGMQRLADGKFEEALADLVQARALDPRGAPAIWRAIGDTYAAAGRRPSALGAWQQAIKQGAREASVFLVLGHEALRSRRLDIAAGLLSTAQKCDDVQDDPAMVWLINADLGETLADLGYADAARRLLATLQSMPPTFNQQTRFRADLADLYRRRAELLQRAGDLSRQLNKPEDASDAYAAAAMWASIDPGAVLLRRVDTLTHLGRPAQGSLLLLEDIARSRGQIDERQLGLIRWLSGVDGLAKPLADALFQVQRDLGAQLTPSAASRMLRARAAALDDNGARAVLREHLAARPADTDALSELLSRAATSYSARAQDIAALATSHPELAETYAETMIAFGVQTLQTIGSLESTDTHGGRLTAAHALQKLGLNDRAWSNIEAVGTQTPQSLAERAELAAKLGRYQDVVASLNAITPEHPVQRAIALRSLQRYADAYAMIAPVASGPAATTEQLMLAAELALRTGSVADTERFLRLALQNDPTNEQAAQSLISVYSPPSPVANEDKLTALLRGIREAEPSSRLIRQLAARELLKRGLWSQAETAYIGIAEQGVPLPDDVDALVTAWERQTSSEQAAAQASSSLDRAQRWIDRKLESHPDSPWLIAASARIQTAAGNASAAESALAERLKSIPNPDLARLRETIVRGSLGRPEDADEMALQRLAVMPPTIDVALERAEALVRAGRGTDAPAALRKSLPAELTLSGEQSSRMLALIAKSVQDELQPQPVGGLRSLALMDIALERGLTLAPSLVDARLALLCRQRPGDREALVAAVKALVAIDAARAEGAVRRAAQSLFSASDQRGTLTLLISAMPALATPASELAQIAIGLTAQYGDASDALALLKALGDERLTTYVQAQSLLGVENVDSKTAAVEVLHIMGNMATNLTRDDAAEAFYREALKINPDHAMTNNNLGYYLLDTGQKLDDAAALIERAYRAEPTAANIIDSLAWLRYKQGVIADRVGPDGRVVLEGAMSLLERASDIEGDNNPDMLDHLGDASYKAGKPEDAKRRWQQAVELLNGQIELTETQLRDANDRRGGAKQPEPPLLVKVRAQVTRLNSKITDLAAGKVPAVAESGLIPPPPVADASN